MQDKQACNKARIAVREVDESDFDFNVFDRVDCILDLSQRRRSC